MAQRQIIVDDLDGSEGASILPFGLDGEEYEIDLSETNMAKYRGMLEALVEKARKVPATQRRNASAGRTPSTRARSGSTPKEREENAEIRAWYRAQGGTISDRGRINEGIRAKFYAAKRGGETEPRTNESVSSPATGSVPASEGQETSKPAPTPQTAAQGVSTTAAQVPPTSTTTKTVKPGKASAPAKTEDPTTS